MELKITRLPVDDRSYSIDSGNGTRFLKAPALKQWLFDLGVGDSTVSAVLEIDPSESVKLHVMDKVA